jgi:hypothetical protein
MKQTLKTHLISAAITFAASFLTILGRELLQHSSEPITVNLFASLVLTAVRAGVKPLGEALFATFVSSQPLFNPEDMSK